TPLRLPLRVLRPHCIRTLLLSCPKPPPEKSPHSSRCPPQDRSLLPKAPRPPQWRAFAPSLAALWSCVVRPDHRAKSRSPSPEQRVPVQLHSFSPHYDSAPRLSHGLRRANHGPTRRRLLHAGD